MASKKLIINASPRKRNNTAQILNAVKEGAESAGAEVRYTDLYDLKYTGCKSCLGCKRKGNEDPGMCIIRDDLFEILEEARKADHIIIGSPIYFSQPTGQLRCFLERLCFPQLSYNDYSSQFEGSVDVTIILTMNAPEEIYDQMYKAAMEAYFEPLRMLKGNVEIIHVCDTLQVDDYSKYEMAAANVERKQSVHENEFPAVLEKAREIGKR